MTKRAFSLEHAGFGRRIGWPTKEGRVIERTEFLAFDEGRPKTYYPGANSPGRFRLSRRLCRPLLGKYRK
jgi:hypothetical protein